MDEQMLSHATWDCKYHIVSYVTTDIGITNFGAYYDRHYAFRP